MNIKNIMKNNEYKNLQIFLIKLENISYKTIK